jgi:hypothetical protein
VESPDEAMWSLIAPVNSGAVNSDGVMAHVYSTEEKTSEELV